MECLHKFKGILFGYEINVLPDHNNLVYNATLSESQMVMRWQLILEEFGPNIQHITGVYNIFARHLAFLVQGLYLPLGIGGNILSVSANML